MHALLRAMSASHDRAQRLDAVSTAMSVVVAMAGLAATFVSAAADTITAIGALWALVYSTGLMSWTHRELRRAATIQEMFDVRLYGLAWNHVLAGEPVDAPEISRLSSRHRGPDDMIHDYYEIPDFPAPYDVVACQMMNLGWGARVRKRFAWAILTILFTWSMAGVFVGTIADLTVGDLLLAVYIPSLGGLMLGMDMYRRQRDVVKERERVPQHLRAALRTMRGSEAGDRNRRLRELARHVQDSIFLTRVASPRVPNWFFLRFRTTDRIDFMADMEELRSVVTRAHA